MKAHRVLLGVGVVLLVSTSMALAQPASAPVDASPASVVPAQAASTAVTPASAAADEVMVPRFVLRGAVFEGASALNETQLTSAWTPYAGRPVRLVDLREIARRAETLYARAGRPFVAVTVPPQTVVDGIVHLTVIEGRVGSITILGRDAIARRQTAAAFGDVTSAAGEGGATDLNRLFARARQTPGLTVTGTLRRSDTPGAMDLVVQADRKPWTVFANGNNLIGDAVGPYGATLFAQYDGESVFGDRTTLQLFATTSGNQEVARLSHWRQLTASGVAISASALYARAAPQGVAAPLNIANEVVSAKVGIEQRFLVRDGLTLSTGVGLDYYDQQLSRVAPLINSQDQLRSLYGRLELHYLGQARLDGYVEARKGLSLFGASPNGDLNTSRPGGSAQAFVLRGSIAGTTRKFGHLVLAGRLDGQYSTDLPLSSERYSGGNFTIGRGFEPGAIFGDRALAVSIEARFGPFRAERFQLTPFAFYDSARVWSDGSSGQGHLSSAGLGIRADLPGRLRAEVTYARRLDYQFGGAISPGSDSLLVNLTVSLDTLFNAATRERR